VTLRDGLELDPALARPDKPAALQGTVDSAFVDIAHDLFEVVFPIRYLSQNK